MILFNETPSFEKDFKRLLKKYPSLEDDLMRFKKALETDGENLTGLVRIPLGSRISAPFFKARKFRCKSLNSGAMSGIRVILCWQRQSTEVKVTFIEIYYKGQQENHDESKIIIFSKENDLYH